MASGGMQPTSSGLSFQNSTSWNSADPQAASVYRSLLERGMNLSQQKYQPYKGQLVAGFSPDQLKAFQGVRDMQGVQNPYIDAAKGYTESAVGLADPSKFGMDSLSRYMNPFQQNVIDATMANMRNMDQTRLSDLTGRAISAGAMGGDRSGMAKAEYLRGANLTNQQTLANLQSQNYQQAVQQYNQQQEQAIRANQAAAAGMSGLGNQAQSSRLADLQALLGVGGQQQQQQQRGLDVNYQRWQQARSFPYQQLQFLSGLASGIGPLLGGASGTSGFSTSQQSQQSPSLGGQLLGGLFSLGGLLGGSPYSSGLGGLGKIFGMARGGAVSESMTPYGGGGAYVPQIDLQPARFSPPESRLPDVPSAGGGGASKGAIGDITSKLGGMTSSEKAGLGRLVSGVIGAKNPIQLTGAVPSAGMGALSAATAPAIGPREGEVYADGGRVGLWAGGSGEDDDRPTLSDYIERKASEAGYNPKYLKAVMDYESSSDPNRWGGKGGNYYGLIQFGPQEREKYGIVPGKTDAYAQTDAAINFLRDRGYKPNMGLEDMYSTVLAGSPGHYNRADQNGSVAQHVARMRERYGIDGDGRSDIGALAYSDTSRPRPARDSALGAIDDATSGQPTAEPENKPFLSPEVSQALMAAGLGMMASGSPNIGTAIGQGGLAGLATYQNALATNAERAKEARREKIERDKLDAEAALRRAQIGHYETEDAATRRKAEQEAEALRIFRESQSSGMPAAAPKTADLTAGPITGAAPAEPAKTGQDDISAKIAELEEKRRKTEALLPGAGSLAHVYDRQIQDINENIRDLRGQQAEARKEVAKKEEELRKPPTEAQHHSYKFGSRMLEGEKYLLDPKILESAKGGSASAEELAGKIPVVGGYLQSEDYKRFQQAASNWVLGKLRDDSGAAIGTHEYIRDYMTYIPMPWDSPKIIQQKADARRQEEMANALDVHPAQAEEFKKRIEEYHKPRETKQDRRQAINPQGNRVWMVKKDGKWIEEGAQQ